MALGAVSRFNVLEPLVGKLPPVIETTVLDLVPEPLKKLELYTNKRTGLPAESKMAYTATAPDPSSSMASLVPSVPRNSETNATP